MGIHPLNSERQAAARRQRLTGMMVLATALALASTVTLTILFASGPALQAGDCGALPQSVNRGGCHAHLQTAPVSHEFVVVTAGATP